MVLLGAGSVGKTALTVRMVYNEFCGLYDPTIEDFYKCDTFIDKKDVELEIIDTAGQEQFGHPSHILHWIRDLDFKYMLIYDIESEQTFKHVQSIWKYLVRIKEGRIDAVLVGNKSDLFDDVQDIDKMDLTYHRMKYLVFEYYASGYQTDLL